MIPGRRLTPHGLAAAYRRPDLRGMRGAVARHYRAACALEAARERASAHAAADRGAACLAAWRDVTAAHRACDLARPAQERAARRVLAARKRRALDDLDAMLAERGELVEVAA